jgi:hypothetical protein
MNSDEPDEPLLLELRHALHSSVMTEATIEERATTSKDDQWRDRIAEQGRSGLSVKQFCKERGLTEYSFYAWRKRLRKTEPVRFAMVIRERRWRRCEASGEPLEESPAPPLVAPGTCLSCAETLRRARQRAHEHNGAGSA